MSGNVATEKVFKPNQLIALQILACGGSLTEAAGAARVTVRTLGRWMTRPDFVKSLRDMRVTALKHIASRLVGLAGSAVDTLAGILTSEAASDSVKVRVAIATLDAAVKWRDATEVEERLAMLEAEVNRIRKRG